jgi:RimJ/RimL family protein N-acetyltransferase
MIRLEPMTEDEFGPFFEASVARYARENTRSGRWSEDGATSRSRREHEQLLPQGLRSPDQFLRTVRDAATGERVGELWFALRSEDGPKQVWIFWLGIDAPHRRKGYGAAALRAVEDEARRLGVDRVGLHVFAHNTGARTLYERAGFETTNVVMWKPVPR